MYEAWLQWRSELPLLSNHHIARCYFPKQAECVPLQLHGFSDASENAYAGVVYRRIVDSEQNIHISLVMAKTKVAPIKKATIPRLELCGAELLAQLLHHVREVLHIPADRVYAWTDSTIVLGWLTGNPRRFKVYVGNRISNIIQHVSPERWNHVPGLENPADCASRGLFPSELLEHKLWWNGPDWLHSDTSDWPKQSALSDAGYSDEEKNLCFHTAVIPKIPILPLDQYGSFTKLDQYRSFTKLKRVTSWIQRFVRNCCTPKEKQVLSPTLTVPELEAAENYWIHVAQADHFLDEIEAIGSNKTLPNSSSLLPLHPFLDENKVLRVGGRERYSNRPFTCRHPAILHGTHPITKLLIRSEHLRLLHVGPTLLASSLGRRYHIIGPKAIRSIYRACVICRRNSAKPQPQMLGQLPVERITPSPVFYKVGVDYAGPIKLKSGSIRKPTIIKSYVCVFVSLSVKAVHLELVSDLTTEAFIATLRLFIARRGKPSLIWSDHSSNFIGAARELQELADYLSLQITQGEISDFCAAQHITWSFIPEHAPHFGGLWEAALKPTFAE